MKIYSKGKRKNVRGVVLTTELVLLIIAVIIFTVVALFGIARTVIQQATSPKTSIAIVRAEAWKVGNYIVVTAYVQNTGNSATSVSITSVTDGSNTCNISSSTPVTIQPGEVKVISATTGICTNISSNSTVFVIVTAGSQRVGAATVVNSP